MNIFKNRGTAWGVTAGYVGLIYITLGIIGTLQLWLRDHGFQTIVSTAVLVVTFTAAIYLVIVKLNHRSPINLVTLMAACGMYGYIMVSFAPHPSARIHLVEYSILATFFYYTLKFDMKGRQAYIIAWLLTCATGLVDEMIQAYIPTRTFDLNDLMINAMAATIALLTVGLVVEDEK
ncbi:hypothetical protein MNBD_NITROSPINAE01-182 [hydrothermal vent metagenome]|uniref:VanZ-like domain-containing protein n=1 Tax=hydrothermal vent metagenome TaxID=652676 RepID=A0A3B1BMG5_9ZZZZ